MKWSLQRVKRCGFSPQTIVDVGAYRGDWTRLTKRLFPECRVLMVEPQSKARHRLQSVVSDLTDVSYVRVALAAVGNSDRLLYGTGSGSSLLRPAEASPTVSEAVAVSTLDEVTKQHGFFPPDFVKIDVQGSSLQVLAGGRDCLQYTEMILTEVDLLPLYEDADLFGDVTAFLSGYDYQAYDICGFSRRPYDLALWQIDVLYVRKSSKLVSSRRWA